jgi:hypothetical protein
MLEIECIACGNKIELPRACDMDGCNNELNNHDGSVILCDGTGNLHICMDCAEKMTEQQSCGCGCNDNSCGD